MITEAKVKKIVEDGIQAAIPGIIEAMQPAQQVQNEWNDQTVTPDPYLDSCYRAKAKIMEEIATTGKAKTVYVRGQRGTVEVNQSKVALNMIDDQIQQWKDRKTHTPVR